MEDCVRNCKRASAMMESSTTAKAAATSTLTKRLKLDSDFQHNNYSSSNSLIAISSSTEASSYETTSNSGMFGVYSSDSADSSDSAPSLCSGNESSEVVEDSSRLVDLEVKSFETESIHNNFRRESSPCSEVCGDTDGMEEKPAQTTEEAAVKMPSKEEIEEFFAEAEKVEQKRFAEKYNYDVAKDAPLDGRYQWVRLKQ